MAKTHKVKILIAEDEVPIGKALKLKLEHEGFLVELASDGEQALAWLEKSTYDVIVLDLVMPKANGFDVLQRLSTLAHKPKVIVASNLSQSQDEQRARALGADDYIVKSNTPLNDIVEKIKKFIDV